MIYLHLRNYFVVYFHLLISIFSNQTLFADETVLMMCSHKYMYYVVHVFLVQYIEEYMQIN